MVAAVFSRLLPSAEKEGNLIRDGWDRLSAVPGGRSAFSRLVGLLAPYTGSIGARIEELRPGHARVVLKDRRAVRNHLRSVHAVALANLAELTGNIAVAYSLPDNGRFIVAGMNMEYLKKARGTITGTCDCPPSFAAERAEHEIVVRLWNEARDEVCRATLKTLVGPKKR